MLEKVLKIILSKKFYVPVITVVVTLIAIKVLSKVVQKMIVKNTNGINDKRRNTIVVLINGIIKYALILFAAIIILGVYGINVAGFITGLGVAGVVAGLALQDALKDIIMGCNIILDNYFVVGDYVKINDFMGEVIGFSLKNTKIKGAGDSVLVISNREITKVINYSQKDFCLPINIDVAYEEKAEKVLNTLNEILEELKEEKVINHNSTVEGINELDSSSVKYLVVLHCSPKNQYKVKRTLLNKVKITFDKKNIKIPYAQIEVHNG